jgi:hypothetical protein
MMRDDSAGWAHALCRPTICITPSYAQRCLLWSWSPISAVRGWIVLGGEI